MPAFFVVHAGRDKEGLHMNPCIEKDQARQRLARNVAQAAGAFEHLLMSRVPTSVVVTAGGDWMVVTIHEAFSAIERRVAAAGDGGMAKVEAYHRHLFDEGLAALCNHVRERTGVALRGAAAHVDRRTESVLKTFTTRSTVDIFLLGAGVPMLGVPIDAHRHVDSVSGTDGRIAVRERTYPDGSTTMKKVAYVGTDAEES
jgi:hypothetical protein